MLKIWGKRSSRHKVFVPMPFHFEQHLALLDVNKSDSVVVCGHHAAVRVRAQELQASNILAFAVLAGPVATIDLRQVL